MRLAPDRVAAINDGRTKAIERAIGAEMRFAQGIATVLSTDQLPSALTCTLSPMEGDASMWSRIAAAADLAFGARAMLRLRINDEKQPPERPNSDMHTIVTDKINVVRGDQDINPKLPVEMEEVANPDSETKRGGTIRFICRQNRARVGMVEVSYLYVPKRKIKEDDIPPERRKLALDAKDTPLPPAADERTLRDVLGISFELAAEKKKEGFDAKYTPYPHCLNYWGSAHGSGLVAFATMGIPEAAHGFSIQYHQVAIGEFDPANSNAPSTKAFYRKQEKNGVGVYDEDGKLLVRVEFTTSVGKIDDPDAEMAQGMKTNNDDAWEEFERKFGSSIRNSLYRYLWKFRGFEIEDEIAKFSLHLFERMADFTFEKGEFSHWFRTLLRNYCVDRYRSMVKAGATNIVSINSPLLEAEERTFEDVLSSPESSPEHKAMDAEQRRMILSVLPQIKPKYLEAFTRFYFAGQPYDEIAEALNVEVGTVKSRIARAKAMIKELLKLDR